MRKIRRYVGIFVIALVFCIGVAAPTFADSSGTQGETKSGQSVPQNAPVDMDYGGYFWFWLLILMFWL